MLKMRVIQSREDDFDIVNIKFVSGTAGGLGEDGKNNEASKLIAKNR